MDLKKALLNNVIGNTFLLQLQQHVIFCTTMELTRENFDKASMSNRIKSNKLWQLLLYWNTPVLHILWTWRSLYLNKKFYINIHLLNILIKSDFLNKNKTFILIINNLKLLFFNYFMAKKTNILKCEVVEEERISPLPQHTDTDTH